MNIDISKVVSDKLAQMEQDGVIQKKIEETLEKTILAAVTSELESFDFKRKIGDQLKMAVSGVAEQCGLATYNGFIAEKCKVIVQELLSADICEKLQKALDDIMLKKHENIKLSDIFQRYREWVCENTDESDKWDRRRFHCSLEEDDSGYMKEYTCTFADHSLENSYGRREEPDIKIRFFVYREDKPSSISCVYLDGHYMKDTFKLGTLTDFEAFVLNLYYNDTPIILDVDDVDDSDYFDIDV